MKQNLKRLKLPIVFSLAILLLTSCEKDLYYERVTKNETIIEKVSLNDINSPYVNKKILSIANFIKLKNLESKNKSASKLVYDPINNFYFDDENGIYVDNGIINSYTFKMVRPDGDGDLENLVFSSKEDGTYGIYFVKYDFTEDELKNLSETEIENSPKEFEELEVDNTNETTVTSKCFAVIECHVSPRDGTFDGPNEICYYSLHGCGGGPSGASNGGYSDPSGGTGTGTHSTTGTGPVVITGPLGGGGGGTTTQTSIPCAKLKSKTSGSTVYMNNFRAINTQDKYDMNHETGFFEKKTNGVTQYGYGIPGPAKVTYPSSAVAYTHVHNNKPAIDSNTGESFDQHPKMFSPADLSLLIFDCSNASIAAGQTPLDVYGVMASQEGIFSLTIIDSNINISDVNLKWKTFEKNYENEVNDIITETDLTPDQRSEKLQKLMLSQLEFLGLKDKVALFQGTVDELGKLQWTRKILDANRKLTGNPC